MEFVRVRWLSITIIMRDLDVCTGQKVACPD